MEPQQEKLYTVQDYLDLDEGARVELIGGRFYAMVPAPSRQHQKIIGKLFLNLGNYLTKKGGPCEVYLSPFDVYLSENDVVQPDLTVICDPAKLSKRGCEGAPDLIIEVVSPSNAAMDYVKKLHLYHQFKVKEYWIVNPQSRKLTRYLLNEDYQYGEPEVYTGGTITFSLFPDLAINLEELFDE
ncbi:Uma2 family endonuclease [Carboxydocella sp. JDF658]|uniref:Uma2 family endonuclease n=1 Tax=Carboxydocella sp. JDF658 TaxID=1926600 RepID=UPI0009AE3877|nr:Uma2 family endonuclease [Carboxydocella sp. JDF658]GAW31694.1 hypothetical protein JDF658_14590 [Carboxydocella sp. JDF658]